MVGKTQYIHHPRAAVFLTFWHLQVTEGESLLLAGPSGAGKTSILRAVAGLWSSGSGTIRRFGTPVGMGVQGDIFFVPQRPYVVLGTLRDQLLYPTWANPSEEEPSDELSARRCADFDLTCSQFASLNHCKGVPSGEVFRG